MPPFETPYDQKISKLKSKIDRRKGNDRNVPLWMRRRLVDRKIDRYRFQEKNRPVEFRDVQYETDIAGAQRQHSQSLPDIEGRRLALKQQYGFEDSSNPFSVARQLEQDFRTRQGKTLGSYARSGQLYAGSLSNARNIDRRGFEQGLDSAQREYQAGLGELTQEQTAAETALQDAQEQALADAMQRFSERDLEPMAPPGLFRRRKALQRKMRKRKKKGPRGGWKP